MHTQNLLKAAGGLFKGGIGPLQPHDANPMSRLLAGLGPQIGSQSGMPSYPGGAKPALMTGPPQAAQHMPMTGPPPAAVPMSLGQHAAGLMPPAPANTGLAYRGAAQPPPAALKPAMPPMPPMAAQAPPAVPKQMAPPPAAAGMGGASGYIPTQRSTGPAPQLAAQGKGTGAGVIPVHPQMYQPWSAGTNPQDIPGGLANYPAEGSPEHQAAGQQWADMQLPAQEQQTDAWMKGMDNPSAYLPQAAKDRMQAEQSQYNATPEGAKSVFNAGYGSQLEQAGKAQPGNANPYGTPGQGLMTNEEAATAPFNNGRQMPNVTVGGAYGQQAHYDNTDLRNARLGVNSQGRAVPGGETDPSTLGRLRSSQKAPWMTGQAGQTTQLGGSNGGGGNRPSFDTSGTASGTIAARQARVQASGGKMIMDSQNRVRVNPNYVAATPVTTKAAFARELRKYAESLFKRADGGLFGTGGLSGVGAETPKLPPPKLPPPAPAKPLISMPTQGKEIVWGDGKAKPPAAYQGKGEIGAPAWTPTRDRFLRNKSQLNEEQGMLPGYDPDKPRYNTNDSFWAAARGLGGSIAGTAQNLVSTGAKYTTAYTTAQGALAGEGLDDYRAIAGDRARRGWHQLWHSPHSRALDSQMETDKNLATPNTAAGLDLESSMHGLLPWMLPSGLGSAATRLGGPSLSATSQAAGWLAAIAGPQVADRGASAYDAKQLAAGGGQLPGSEAAPLTGNAQPAQRRFQDMFSPEELAPQEAQEAQTPERSLQDLMSPEAGQQGQQQQQPQQPAQQQQQPAQPPQQGTQQAQQPPQAPSGQPQYQGGFQNPEWAKDVFSPEGQQPGTPQDPQAAGQPGQPAASPLPEGFDQMHPTDQMKAIQSLPPEHQAQAMKTVIEKAPADYVNKVAPGASPEEQQQVLGGLAARVQGDQLTPEDMQQGMETLMREHGPQQPQAGPNLPQDLMSMSPEEQQAHIGNLPFDQQQSAMQAAGIGAGGGAAAGGAAAGAEQPGGGGFGEIFNHLFDHFMKLPPMLKLGLVMGIPTVLMGLGGHLLGGNGLLGSLIGLIGGGAGAWAMGLFDGLLGGNKQPGAGGAGGAGGAPQPGTTGQAQMGGGMQLPPYQAPFATTGQAPMGGGMGLSPHQALPPELAKMSPGLQQAYQGLQPQDQQAIQGIFADGKVDDSLNPTWGGFKPNAEQQQLLDIFKRLPPQAQAQISADPAIAPSIATAKQHKFL